MMKFILDPNSVKIVTLSLLLIVITSISLRLSYSGSFFLTLLTWVGGVTVDLWLKYWTET